MLLPWLGTSVPKFYLNGSQFKVLQNPKDFYDTVKKCAGTAKKRIVIASLYLGVGELESDLVHSIKKTQAVNSKSPNFRVKFLLECTRGSRLSSDGSSSRTMLLPLLSNGVNRVKVALYHSPHLRGWLSWILSGRMNETVGLQHMKVYLFDDTLIISGANLSQDYFTQRQDRYLVISDAPELGDFYERLVDTVSDMSYHLRSDNTLACVDGVDPVKGNKGTYISEFRSRVLELLRSEVALAAQRQPKSSHDTTVYPLVQMAPYGVRQDEEVTTKFLTVGCPPGSKLHLASGYFNLVTAYQKALLKLATGDSAVTVDVLGAAPEANGFYKGSGHSHLIPDVYSDVALRFLTSIERLRARVGLVAARYFEYCRPGWTFHAKGLWLSNPGSQLPSVTFTGSPNFGYRSVYRDLESQLIISTTNGVLQRQLADERDGLFDYSEEVTREELLVNPGRHVSRWVRWCVPFVRRVF